jgi:hypothetical protein
MFFTIAFGTPFEQIANAYAEALAFSNKVIADGLLLNEPGLEPGEIKEHVGYVARRQKKNDDGTTTPVLDLYSPHEAMKFKYLSVYLNTPDDVTAFEVASGLKVNGLPLVAGKASLERGDEETDKFIIRVVNPSLFVIMKPNPRYDENSDEKRPKRLFVRWEYTGEIQRQPAPQPPQPTLPATETPKAQENGAAGQSEGKNNEPWQWFGLTEKQWNMVLNAGGWHPLRLTLSAFTPDNPNEHKRWYNAAQHANNTIGALTNEKKIVDTMTVGETLKVLADHYKAKLLDAA